MWGPKRGGAPKGWGPEGVGPRRGGVAQNFALFFSLSRHNFHSFFPLLGVIKWNFGGVGAPGPSNVHVLGSGAPPFGAPPFGAPTFGALFFLGLGPHLFGPENEHTEEPFCSVTGFIFVFVPMFFFVPFVFAYVVPIPFLFVPPPVFSIT